MTSAHPDRAHAADKTSNLSRHVALRAQLLSKAFSTRQTLRGGVFSVLLIDHVTDIGSTLLLSQGSALTWRANPCRSDSRCQRPSRGHTPVSKPSSTKKANSSPNLWLPLQSNSKPHSDFDELELMLRSNRCASQ
eukprot:266093-Rhodomonas_salina.1